MKSLTKAPKFAASQQVHFLGGKGRILFCQPDGKNWLYGVEMPLGKEPDMGRIGAETIILMMEGELFIL